MENKMSDAIVTKILQAIRDFANGREELRDYVKNQHMWLINSQYAKEYRTTPEYDFMSEVTNPMADLKKRYEFRKKLLRSKKAQEDPEDEDEIVDETDEFDPYDPEGLFGQG
jgi:hypothetical protein